MYHLLYHLLYRLLYHLRNDVSVQTHDYTFVVDELLPSTDWDEDSLPWNAFVWALAVGTVGTYTDEAV